MAIDDIRFIACNPSTPASSVACDFETDTCGWIQDPYDQFDWLRNNGSTASRNTGPPADHSKGDSSGTAAVTLPAGEVISCLVK